MPELGMDLTMPKILREEPDRGSQICGYQIQVGSWHNDGHKYCDEEMTGKDTERGGREYTCGDCGTELIVSPNGLVFDIYEGAAA